MNPLALVALGLLAQPEDARPNFSRDIAPIVFEHCVSCHRSGGSAPFSLETYDEARARAHQIAEVTASRKMPPWLPKEGHGDLAGARRLPEHTIALLRSWSMDPRAGDLSEMPAPPELVDGWQLGEPDLVVSMPQEYTLAPVGHDVYRNFVLPISIDAPRHVRAIEFRPGGANIVHHARILVDRTGGSRELDEQDDEPGYDGMIVDRAEFPDGLFLGWAPGKVPVESSDVLVWTVEPGTDLVVQAHMMPSERPRPVRVSVGLFFTDEPPSRRAAVLQLGSKTIDIPPGANAYPVDDSYVLPADVDVIGIYPHAHYICREMRVSAHLPDGSERSLLWIPEWDFFWQDEYRYRKPVPLPKGTRITMRFVYDNSSDNRSNPFDPPERIRFGPMSTDEMGDVLLMVIPREPEMLEPLRDDLARNELRRDVAGYEKMIADDPSDAAPRNALGFAYSQLGRTENAIAAWRDAVEIDPSFAEAFYNLGGALAGARSYDDAAEAYRQAIRANPTYAEAHNNLGVVLQSDGQLKTAIDEYRKAIELRPSYAYAHHNLGNALLADGKVEPAIEQWRRAIEIEPDYAEAHYSLGNALGRLGRIDEEMSHYRLAIEAKPDYAQALHNLGAVLLLSGRPDEAISLLRRAVEARPDYGLAYANLGRALAGANDANVEDAIEMFRTALSLRPEDSMVHRDLGQALSRTGELDTAITHYHVALSLAPSDPDALAGLAWLLAVHPDEGRRDPERAIQLAERASRLVREPSAKLLDSMAAAYASAERFDGAVRVCENALAAAHAEGDRERAAAIEARLSLYRSGTPFRLP